MHDQLVYSAQDVLSLLDELLADRDGSWWNEFYADRTRPIPFFADRPDENLVQWHDQGLLPPGRALELGCGPGRNAVYLASRGYQVDAVDFSAGAIDWARQRAAAAAVTVSFQCCSIFDASLPGGAYDLVYDTGCFHHLAPHRRASYVELVLRALRPGGRFGLVCFRPEGGSGLSDLEVYQRRDLGGGLGYSEQQLRALCGGRLEILRLRPMISTSEQAGQFGAGFLWVLLAARPGENREPQLGGVMPVAQLEP